MREQMNLLQSLPDASSAEIFEELVGTASCRIERIVSRGQVSTEWYDQEEHEWVAVLRGAATILLEDGTEHSMSVGDTLLLPAHTRHKVTWTHPEENTVWLAVFF